ncbi:MAG: glycosyltransferase [Chitinivibrionales bacterium]|nr:glycosyltransferase [Chitinivibrionales bacterium]
MSQADLHVHSIHSGRPSEWFLQKIGSRESYNEPEFVYSSAKKRGMEFVTITDHNTMEGVQRLLENHPHDVFSGVEVTTYFPQDQCKIHVLVWGLSKSQFVDINYLRNDIFLLREYLKVEKLAHAVAHASFAINKVMSIKHFQQLLLLFNHFEAINGSRTAKSNDILATALNELTPEIIENLYDQYHIEPMDDSPWHKALVGGSDDHSGLFIAKTYTSGLEECRTADDFLKAITRKRCAPSGRSNDFRGFAFSLYKIAYDFSQVKNQGFNRSAMMTLFSNALFQKNGSSFRTFITMNKMKIGAKADRKKLINLLETFIRELENQQHKEMEDKIEMVYKYISMLADELMTVHLNDIQKVVRENNFLGLLGKISGLLTPVFLTMPFFSTIKILHESSKLSEDIERLYHGPLWPMQRKFLWFTDTLFDLNGVSEIIRDIGNICMKKNIECVIVHCPIPQEDTATIPFKTVALPYIRTISNSVFPDYTLRIPSLLRSLQLIYELQPDEIIISTPGPIGLLGLLCGKLMNISCTGIYHTDFYKYSQTLITDEFVTGLVKTYEEWFYKNCTTIRVPSMEYMNILQQRGYDRCEMKLFKRGIDSAFFNMKKRGADPTVLTQFGLYGAHTLLYVGRISKEKNVDFLLSIHEEILKRRECKEDVDLLCIGDGPDFMHFKKMSKKNTHISFAGRIERENLPSIYCATTILVFPSHTDTFGMTVMEAQACGLPAVVSNHGGPQEIIIDTVTGHVVSRHEVKYWADKIESILLLADNYPEKYLEMRYVTEKNAHGRFDWDSILPVLFKSQCSPLANKSADTTHDTILSYDNESRYTVNG